MLTTIREIPRYENPRSTDAELYLHASQDAVPFVSDWNSNLLRDEAEDQGREVINFDGCPHVPFGTRATSLGEKIRNCLD
jgi:hypothetical protein